MLRTYIKKPGTRNYVNYSKETLERCLAEVENGFISPLQAFEKLIHSQNSPQHHHKQNTWETCNTKK